MAGLRGAACGGGGGQAWEKVAARPGDAGRSSSGVSDPLQEPQHRTDLSSESEGP